MNDHSPAGPVLDAALVRRWLGILHGDSPGLVHICSTDDWGGKTFTNLDSATDYVRYLDGEGRPGIYARVTTLRADLPRCTMQHAGRDERAACTRGWHGRGGVAETAALSALWADVDLAGPGHAEQDLPPDEPAGRAIIAATGLPEPTLWIHSGGGLYPIWLLDRPHHITADNAEQAKRLAKDWQAIIEHAAAARGWRYGRGVGDLARVLRVAGTINRKAGLARPCRIVSASSNRYTVEQLVDALDQAVARIAPPAAVVPAGSPLIGPPAAGTPRPEGSVAPGEEFNQRADWAQILVPAGWREHYRADEVTYWTRPGKPSGISASTNALGTDRLHVFTTSAAPLDAGESYSKFGAYAALHFGGDHKAAARALASQGYGSPLPDPAAEQRAALAELLGGTAGATPTPPVGITRVTPTEPVGITPAVAAPEPAAPARPLRAPEIDVTNPATAAEWLRSEAGRNRLAGLFHRAGQVVHTPREGEEGYIPLGDVGIDEDGPAQVRPVTDSALASRITYTYGVYRMVKRGEDYEPVAALFPRSAARTALDVPDMLPNLRQLRGVIHSPVVRPDGTLIEAPGYDRATGLLHLPEPGLTVPRVPDRPTPAELAAAVALVDEMLAGFPFVSEHYRANYIGALITPLLRAIAPPPYKLHAIEAHQPGSGKTLLANLARHIHGGVFRAEMPDDDAELRKQITAILTITTGPVVVLDNVSGALKSSTLAGLLTSPLWDDRPLGSTSWTRAANDRLWTITGNNLSVGGDLPRRTLRTVIDPGQPNPELRTGFAIADLEEWVKARRGELLAALLTIVRAWVVAGMPIPPPRASDGYARWVHTISGILAVAGIEGTFDDGSTQVEIGTDDDEWAEFLAAAHRALGTRPWTAKELLDDIDTGNLINPGRIPVDALPADLEAKITRADGVGKLARPLTWWLRNRDGRWAGGLTVRAAGVDAHKTKLWQIHLDESRSSGNPVTPVTFRPLARARTIDPLRSVTVSERDQSGSAGKMPEVTGLPDDLESGSVA